MGLACIQGLAQSYQSTFADVKFDRAKGAATLTGGVQIDAATGAASMDIPLGPGIGERGLKFRPHLSLRVAPQVGISSVNEQYLISTSPSGFQYWGTQTVDTLYQRGYGSASFSPGTFDLALWGAAGKQSNYTLPDGGGGSILGTVPSGMTTTAAQQILSRFGVSGTIGTLPADSKTGSAPFIQMGSGGHLILGVNQLGPSDQGTDEVQDWLYSTMIGSTASQQRWPRRLLVVQGDVAYEFTYVSHLFMTQNRPYLVNSERDVLHAAHYAVTRILNRFGENISFAYDGDGIGYTATWSTNTAVKIQVHSAGSASAPAMPCLTRSDYNMGALTQIRVAYEGSSQPVSSLLLKLGSPVAGTTLGVNSGNPPGSYLTTLLHGQRLFDGQWGEAVLNVQPSQVTQEITGESIQFTYAAGPTTQWGGSVSVTPTILSSVSFPNRTISLAWDAYKYKANTNPNAWAALPSTSRRPSWAYGVKQLIDTDTVAGVGRTTSYARVVPQLNWFTSVPAIGDNLTEYWVSQDFYTAITTPDWRIEVHRFTEPEGANGTSGNSSMSTLAFLKGFEREVRYYEPGASWSSDLSVADPAYSSAYKWVAKDRLSLHSVGNPGGAFDGYAVPYATRTRTWDRDSRTFTAEEITNWSATSLSWTQTHRTTNLTTNPPYAFEMMNLQSQGGSFSSPGASVGTEDLITRSFDNLPAEWLYGRVSLETTTRVADNTSNGTTAGAPPAVAKTLDPVFNTLQTTSSGVSGDLYVITTINYQGGSGLSAAQPANAKISSPQGLTHSNLVGVDSYGYDSNGFLSSINIRANPTTILGSQQSQDALGRPTSQTDADGRTTLFTWETGGRLYQITPPGGDIVTTVTYDDATHRGVTLMRGAQVQEFRYNGFGELVLERRKDPSGNWSHRIYGFDGAGRGTGVTVWLPNRGDDHETLWKEPNLTTTIYQTVTIPGTSVCKRWGPIDPDTGERECVQWQTTPDTTQTTTLNPLYTGTSTSYDVRGRVQKVVDATGVTSTSSYPVSTGFLKVVVLGGTQTTSFLNDSAGRLKRVTDAKSQVTNYSYNASNRIVAVSQSDALGHAQPRSWTYNSLGWLTSLTQPESGTTSYSNFTVHGKPQATNYNGRVVNNAFDYMARPTETWSDDGSVNQGFRYDSAGGRGHIAWNWDGSVNATYGYDAATGRLTSLSTTAAGQTYTQSFGYGDGYGNRTSGHTSHAQWTQSYHLATGLPSRLACGAQSIADTSSWEASYDAVSWMPKAVFYGNGSYSGFSYGADQSRLSGLDHFGPGGAILERWGYSYDGVGNLIQELDKQTGLSDTYGFDALNRLVGAVIQSPTYGAQHQIFDYDAFGNRISASTTSPGTVAPSTLPLSLDPNNQALWLHNQLPSQMVNGASTGAMYDAQGNLTQVYAKPGDTANSITMVYDALGRVTAVAHSGKGVREVYQYRADGLRTVIDDYLWGTFQKTRIQIYDDARRLVSQYEKNTSGTITWKKDILYLGSREAAELDAAGMHVTQVDQLGSPRVVTGPSGQVETRQKYLPFGELLEQTGYIKTAKGYTGHEQTDSSGMIYMQARFYLPSYGRFASPDPARDQHFEETQSWNIYSYVRNNPIMNTDPTGMETEDEKKNTTATQGPQGAMSGTDDYSHLWQNDVNKGAESVSQLLDRKGQEAYEKGNIAGWIGLGVLNAAYQVFTPGGDRLSQVNARAQNGEDVPTKDLAIAGATALGQLALTAAPQLSTSGGSASHVFWSGGTPAKQAAAALAKAEGGVTLEMTAGGRLLDKATTAGNYKYMKPLWNFASRNFANGAEGSVTAVQSMSRGVRVDSIWRSIEYSTLKSSGNPINWYVIP